MTYRADTDNGTGDDPVAAVPEPSGVLGLLAVGAFGAGLRLLRRRQN